MKAEFDSLRNTFQSQLNEYNSSIDNKIDVAIASYLAGIKTGNSRTAIPVLSGEVYMFDNTDASTRMRYVYGPPAMKGTTQTGEWSDNATYGKMVLMSVGVNSASSHNSSNWWQTKLAISNVDSVNSIAAWRGRYTKAYDEVNLTYTNLNFNSINWGAPNTYPYITRYNANDNKVFVNTNLFGKDLFHFYFVTALQAASASVINLFLNSIDNYWGNVHNENTILFGNSIAYDCFSNYDTNRNWGYKGTSESLYQTINSSSDILEYTDKIFITSSDTFNIIYCNGWMDDTKTGTKTTYTRTLQRNPYWSTDSGRTDVRWYSGDKWRFPGVGFETTYIDNWNDLYLPAFDSFSNEMYNDRTKGYTSLRRDSAGNYHLPMYAGIPIVAADKNEKVQFVFRVKNYKLNTTATSVNYGNETLTNPTKTYIWAKSSPFTTNDPNSEADLTITGVNVKKDTSSGYNKGFYITSDSERIKIEGMEENCYVWLKWSTNNKNGGGVVTIPNEVIIEKEE